MGLVPPSPSPPFRAIKLICKGMMQLIKDQTKKSSHTLVDVILLTYPHLVFMSCLFPLGLRFHCIESGSATSCCLDAKTFCSKILLFYNVETITF